MVRFDRILLGRQARELGFVRDTFEKVCRLVEVLSFMEKDPLLGTSLALKGGTAINLTIFNLPRLSVDIDLDYTKDDSRDVMLAERQQISIRMGKYMENAGYVLSPKSKQYHALDSYVYEYVNAGGVKDNLKIEINYMLRCHLLPVCHRSVMLPWREGAGQVLCVHPLEIIAAKTVALLNRAAPRDLYDLFIAQQQTLIGKEQENLYRKSVVFYAAITAEKAPETFDFSGINAITARKIKTDLVPVLRRAAHFDCAVAQQAVQSYLQGILVANGQERRFWQEFAKGSYRPELVFDDADMLTRIKMHPMALWKCAKILNGDSGKK